MASFSRRRLLGQSVAALALAPPLALVPGLARAATGSHLNQDPPTHPDAAENIQGAADGQNHMTVQVWLNGKGPYRFVVDTGADRTVLADDVVKSLGMNTGEQVIVQGIARALPAQSVQLANLRVGPVTIDDLAVPVLPRALLGGDGYLGLDVIDRQAVTFDFQNRELFITHSERFTNYIHLNDALVRVDGSRGRLTATNSSVDGVHAAAFIDSGAEYSIGNTQLFTQLAQRGATYASADTIQLFGVTGGITGGRLTRVDRVKMGPVTFGNSVLVICDLPVFDIWGLADKPALFIGMNFLRQTSAVTIDYGRKELRFRLGQLRMASRA